MTKMKQYPKTTCIETFSDLVVGNTFHNTKLQIKTIIKDKYPEEELEIMYNFCEGIFDNLTKAMINYFEMTHAKGPIFPDKNFINILKTDHQVISRTHLYLIQIIQRSEIEQMLVDFDIVDVFYSIPDVYVQRMQDFHHKFTTADGSGIIPEIIFN